MNDKNEYCHNSRKLSMLLIEKFILHVYVQIIDLFPFDY